MSSPYWFELAVVFGLAGIGNILFSGFAQHEPKWRRLAKMFVGAAVAVLVSAGAGRAWFFVLLGAVALAVVVIHGWWLPRHGINGWTAEPKEKYFALRGWRVK